MTKRDMVLLIAKRTRMEEADVRRVVQLTLDGITETLATEGRIELRDFGVFTVKTRMARKARNPKTGEPVMAPSRKAVTFKTGKFMEDRVNGIVGPADSDAAPDEEEPPTGNTRNG